jgi:O-antigen ligase
MPIALWAATNGPYALMFLGFTTPLSGPVGTAVAFFLAALFLLRGNCLNRLKELAANPVVLAVLFFLILHGVGLLWTEDFKEGWRILSKQWRLLFIPFLMTFVGDDRRDRYIDAFILGMAIVHGFSYLHLLHWVDFQILDRISYNPLLAWAVYLIFQTVVFTDPPPWKRRLYGMLLITMSANMMLTDGRTGQVVFVVLVFVSLLQVYRQARWKAFVASLLVTGVLSTAAYLCIPTFKARLNGAIDEVRLFEMNRPSPDGNDRITYYLNTVEIIAAHPFLGVGTGDFRQTYDQVHQVRSPEVITTDDPHNNFLFAQAQFGILGILSLLAIFFFQVKCALSTPAGFLRNLRMALPIFFMTICLFGSYLLGHFSGLTFAYFTAVLYDGSKYDFSARAHTGKESS